MSNLNLVKSVKMKLIEKYTSDNSGATAIEFAIAFPIFLFFLFGVIEFALITWGNSMMNNVLLQASRAGMVGCVRSETTLDEEGRKICKESFEVTPQSIRNTIRERTAGVVRACDTSKLRISAWTIDDISNLNFDAPGEFNIGQGSQLVAYRVEYDWPVFFPLVDVPSVFGDFIDYRFGTVVRNEPFGRLQDRNVSDTGC